MKKIFSIIPILLVLLLSSCRVPEVPKSYYYRFGYVSLEDDGLLESFTYSVEAKDNVYDSQTSKPPFHLVGTGTYTLKVYHEEGTLYRITTDFSFQGRYKYPNTDTYSEEFEDSFTGVSYMKVDASSFEPVSMTKEYLTTIAYVDGIRRASYVVNVTYTKKNKGYTINSTVEDRDIDGLDEDEILKIADEKNSGVTTELQGRVIDTQEQIFFALRLQTITETFTDSITAFNPMDAISQTITAAVEQEKMVKKFGGKDYPCFQVRANMRAQDLGAAISLFYTEAYPIKYIYVDENGIDWERQLNAYLLLEIKQGDLIYTLTQYQNHAMQVSE